MLGKRSRDVSIGFPGKPESESNSDEGENLGSLSSPWLQPHPSFCLTFLTVAPGLAPGCKRYHYLIYILFFIPGILPSEDYFFSWRRKKCLLTQLHYVLSPLVMSNSLQPHGQQPTRLHCPWRFSRQEYWSGLPCPPPGALPNPGSNPHLLQCKQNFCHLSTSEAQLCYSLGNVILPISHVQPQILVFASLPNQSQNLRAI